MRNYFSTHRKQYEEQAERLDASRLPTDVPGSALLFGATKPASRAEIMSSFPSKYTTDILVARYFNSYDPCTCKLDCTRVLCLFTMLISDPVILHGPTFQAQVSNSLGPLAVEVALTVLV